MSEFLYIGYPTSDELKMTHQFEDRLIDAVECSEFAIMSMILTGNGIHELVFHVKDSRQFIKPLTDMP